MNDLNTVLSKISKCDTDRPYVFVSYSSNDCEVVWRDVLKFQEDGYNVWLDEKNLDKRKESWKDDALAAIQDADCKLVVFYVSASSLCSLPCLNELLETTSETTKTFHGAKEVGFIAVDAEPIGDITEFYNRVFERQEERRERGEITKETFNHRVTALRRIFETFFKTNNERVRVHPRTEENRKGDYYGDIQQYFPDKARIRTAKAPEPAHAAVPVVTGEPEFFRQVPPGMEAVLEQAEQGDREARFALTDHFFQAGNWRASRYWAETLSGSAGVNVGVRYALAYCSWMIAKNGGGEDDWAEAEWYSENAGYFNFNPDAKKTMDLIWSQSVDALCGLYNSLYEKAEAGDPEACYELARRYTEHWERSLRFSGEFHNQRDSTREKLRYRAGKWYRKAAEQQYPPALCALGKCYDPEYGEYGLYRVKKEPQEALRLYRQAAELGDPEARRRLAELS